MTTQPVEATETIEPTSDIITDDGMVVTPTHSPVKADLFDRSASWIVAAVTLLVVVGFGFAAAFSMGLAAQKHEITSTTYNQAGVCLSVQSFMIPGNEAGENPALFAKYQASHPNEVPENIGCPIPFENNTNANR